MTDVTLIPYINIIYMRIYHIKSRPNYKHDNSCQIIIIPAWLPIMIFKWIVPKLCEVICNMSPNERALWTHYGPNIRLLIRPVGLYQILKHSTIKGQNTTELKKLRHITTKKCRSNKNNQNNWKESRTHSRVGRTNLTRKEEDQQPCAPGTRPLFARSKLKRSLHDKEK